MSSSNAITSEQIEATKVWIKKFYEALDSNTFDVHQWLNEYYQPDAVMNMGNDISVKGHNDLATHFIEDQKQKTKKHNVKYIDVLADRIYVRLDVSFILNHDPEQQEITVKVLALFLKKINENKLSSVDIFVDPTPVIERFKALAPK